MAFCGRNLVVDSSMKKPYSAQTLEGGGDHQRNVRVPKFPRASSPHPLSRMPFANVAAVYLQQLGARTSLHLVTGWTSDDEIVVAHGFNCCILEMHIRVVLATEVLSMRFFVSQDSRLRQEEREHPFLRLSVADCRSEVK